MRGFFMKVPQIELFFEVKQMRTFLSSVSIFLIPMVFQAQAAELPKGDHLIVSNLIVKNKDSLSKSKPYLAAIDIRTTGDSVEIKEMCFLWSGEGPFCFKNFKMAKDAGGGVHPTIGLSTGNPGSYSLTAYMRYKIGGKKYSTNQVKTNIKVK